MGLRRTVRRKRLARIMRSVTIWEETEVALVMLEGRKRTVMQVSVVFGIGDTLEEGGGLNG